jgi:hypothetical protein
MDPNTVTKISRNGVEIGEFKLWQIEALVRTGMVLLTDHYWCAGMEGWEPVTKLLEIIAKAKKDWEIERAKTDTKSEEHKRNNFFKCNCCRGTFPRPEGVFERFIKGGVILFLSGILSLIAFSGGSTPGAGIVVALFGFGSMMLFIIGFGFMLSAFVRSPSCPGCGSSNFAKPEKPELSPKQ